LTLHRSILLIFIRVLAGENRKAHRFEHRGEVLAAKTVVSAGDKLLGPHTG